MEKLYLRKELIITKLTPVQQRTSKRISEKNKKKWGARSGDRLEDDGLDWALDISPIYSSKLPEKGKKPTETFPMTFYRSTPVKDESEEEEDDDDCLIVEEEMKVEVDEDGVMNPASVCVASLAKEEEEDKAEEAEEDGLDVGEYRELRRRYPEEEEQGTNQDNMYRYEIPPEQRNVVYPCKTCGITFSSAKYVEQHAKWCRGSRTKLAKAGDAEGSAPSKRYKCTTCGYSTDVSSHLSAHLRRHTGERPYACNLCPYRAAEACTLARHRLAHSGARRYACPLCPHRAAFAGDLQKHMRRHTGERPFACLLCPYRAARPGSLKDHMATHHGENKKGVAKCKACGYSMKGAAQVRRHKCGGGQKLFPCYLCSYNATTLHLLTRHIQTAHPDLISLYKPNVS